MKILTKILLAGLIISTISCSSDDDTPTDTTAPTVTSVKLNETEMIGAREEIEVAEEDSLAITITAADNNGLSELSINIHYGEGHDHEDHDHRSKKANEPKMSFLQVIQLSGTSGEAYVKFADSLHYEKAEYHVEIAILDEEGNRTEAVYEFHLEGEDGEDDHKDDSHDHEDGEDDHKEEEHEEEEHNDEKPDHVDYER